MKYGDNQESSVKFRFIFKSVTSETINFQTELLFQNKPKQIII